MMHVQDDTRYIYVNVSVLITFTYELKKNRVDMKGTNLKAISPNIIRKQTKSNNFLFDELKHKFKRNI